MTRGEECRARRERWQAAGLCNRCGKQPPREGKKNCEPCSVKDRDRVRAYIEREVAKLPPCERCGNPLKSLNRKPGSLLCQSCAASTATSKRWLTGSGRNEVNDYYITEWDEEG